MNKEMLITLLNGLIKTKSTQFTSEKYIDEKGIKILKDAINKLA